MKKKAYQIAKYRKINDLEALGIYAEKAKKVIEAFGGRSLVRGGNYVTLEGEVFIRTVVWEFENINIATKCHESKDYQEAWSLAKNTTIRDLMIIEGV